MELVRPKRGLFLAGFALVVVNRISGFALPYCASFAIDNVIVQHRYGLLKWLVLVMFLATTIHSATSFALVRICKCAEKLVTDLRQRVRAHVGRLPMTFFDSVQTGTLVHRIMRDVEVARNLVSTEIFEFAGALLTASIAVVILFRINVLMTMVTSGLLVCFALGLRRNLKRVAAVQSDVRRTRAAVAGRLSESVAGVSLVKIYTAEDRENRVFAHGVSQLLRISLRVFDTKSVMTLFTVLLGGILSSLIILVGTWQVINGKLSIGDLFTYTWILAFLDWPVSQIVSVGTNLADSSAGLERTQELLAEHPENRDPRRHVGLQKIKGAIEFENVSFSYDGVNTVLTDVSFTCSPGSVTALVGPSGAGKSTTIGLIAAFYAPSKGRILVDGVDLGTVTLESYRTQLGAVLQESFLFDGSIRENVTFAQPEASDRDFAHACRIARVDQFAEALSTGYETLVGERGVRLSCGQRQRISIARAVLAMPRILLLDEATSSLDSESEAHVQHAILSIMNRQTTIVIAHRLSTILHADQILVLDEGKIVERGTHPQLYSLRGRYYELYTAQNDSVQNRCVPFLRSSNSDRNQTDHDFR